MNLGLVASSLVLALLLASPSDAADEAKCQELFTKADNNHDGNLGGQEVHVSKFMLTEVGFAAPKEGMMITKNQFMERCMKK